MIEFPSDTKALIDAIRNAIGRNVTFYVRYEVPCSACLIDPITNTSTNSFCPVCSGIGYVVTHSGTDVLAHITPGGVDNLMWQTAGQNFTGDTRIQLEYTVANKSLIEQAEYVIVDTIKNTVIEKYFRGVPTINRIILDLRQEE